MKNYLSGMILCFLAIFPAGIAGAEMLWNCNPDATGAGIVTPWHTDQLESQQLSKKIAFSDKTTLSGMDICSATGSGISSLSIPGAFDGWDHGLYDESNPVKNTFDFTGNKIHDSTFPIADSASILLLGIGMIALARFRSIKKRLYFIRSLIPETHFYRTFERFFSLLHRLSTEMKVPGITR